jgi:hypothetical protein
VPSINISIAESAPGDLEEVQSYTEQGAPEVGARLIVEINKRVEASQTIPKWDVECPNSISTFCGNSSIHRFGSCTDAIHRE